MTVDELDIAEVRKRLHAELSQAGEPAAATTYDDLRRAGHRRRRVALGVRAAVCAAVVGVMVASVAVGTDRGTDDRVTPANSPSASEDVVERAGFPEVEREPDPEATAAALTAALDTRIREVLPGAEITARAGAEGGALEFRYEFSPTGRHERGVSRYVAEAEVRYAGRWGQLLVYVERDIGMGRPGTACPAAAANCINKGDTPENHLPSPQYVGVMPITEEFTPDGGTPKISWHEVTAWRDDKVIVEIRLGHLTVLTGGEQPRADALVPPATHRQLADIALDPALTPDAG